MNYFFLSITAIVIVFLLDLLLKTNLYKNIKFWTLQIVVLVLTTLVDSISSGLPIVIFNETVILQLRIGFVPVENYLFGFSLITLSLVLFEYFNNARK